MPRGRGCQVALRLPRRSLVSAGSQPDWARRPILLRWLRRRRRLPPARDPDNPVPFGGHSHSGRLRLRRVLRGPLPRLAVKPQARLFPGALVALGWKRRILKAPEPALSRGGGPCSSAGRCAGGTGACPPDGARSGLLRAGTGLLMGGRSFRWAGSVTGSVLPASLAPRLSRRSRHGRGRRHNHSRWRSGRQAPFFEAEVRFRRDGLSLWHRTGGRRLRFRTGARPALSFQAWPIGVARGSRASGQRAAFGRALLWGGVGDRLTPVFSRRPRWCNRGRAAAPRAGAPLRAETTPLVARPGPPAARRRADDG